MLLIGSKASPYVRKIRLQLGQEVYKFLVVDIFSYEGKQIVQKYSPCLRIPVLVDEKTTIWDSYLIAQYLEDKTFDLETKKNLFLINEMTDAGIQLYQLRKFHLDESDTSVFSQNNLTRIKNILSYFDQMSLEWNLLGRWVFCTLDWFLYRDIYDFRNDFIHLNHFYQQSQNEKYVQETDPRL
ncbi:MAG: glutathione S-transferase family protein [Bacteriovoracaceae bacterium]|jgi:glutathione S-transferase|nr:glutathione S-transferase family protein [Bacteriovoracaceae bacterium]